MATHLSCPHSGPGPQATLDFPPFHPALPPPWASVSCEMWPVVGSLVFLLTPCLVLASPLPNRGTLRMRTGKDQPGEGETKSCPHRIDILVEGAGQEEQA